MSPGDPGTPESVKLRHELANLLAAVIANVHVMLLDEAALPPDAARGLREIESLTRRMREVLAASRDPS